MDALEHLFFSLKSTSDRIFSVIFTVCDLSLCKLVSIVIYCWLNWYLISSAELLIGENKVEEAITILRELIDRNPENVAYFKAITNATKPGIV